MKLYVENNQQIPAIQILEDSAPTPVGFTDKNTIVDWHKFGIQKLGEYFGFNYLTWRNKILTLVVAEVNPDYSLWANLSPEEKAIAIELILAPYALRVPEVSDDIDKANWRNLVIQSQGITMESLNGRARVVEQMREAVSEELRVETIVKTEVDLFNKDTYLLIGYYIRSNAPDFKQWLTNEVGSPYENAGFSDTSYYSIARRDYLLNIYQGNY